MHNLLRSRLVMLIVVLSLATNALSACGSASRGQDAAPIPQEMPAKQTAAAPQAITKPELVVEITEEPTRAVEPSLEPPAAEEGQPVQPAGSELINFNINGGIIGFCDSLVVTAAGEYTWQSCRGEASKSGTLVGDELSMLQTWNTNLAAFTIKTEDNPGGPDNMVSELVFNGAGPQEADDIQRQIIFDWTNGLLIRLFPQPTPPPTPEPPQAGPDGLCPDISRPAMLIADYDNPSNLILIDPDSQTRCDIPLPQPPFGRIVTAAGHIYYPAYDPEQKQITVWQIRPTGEQVPLAFTTVAAEQVGPLNFVISADGGKIAWGQAVVNFDLDPPVYRNDLWVANIDGSEQVTLLAQLENTDRRFVQPLRFSQDNTTLFYALQPDGLDGSMFSFSGRFDNVYAVSAAGGEAALLFACPPEAVLCGGDISPDGNLLAYADTVAGQVQVINRQGGLVASLTPPTTDYIGPALFGPTGNLALVSATLLEAASEEELPRPNPGTILLVKPPYTGEPETLLSDNTVATLWEWLDENRLAYGSVIEEGNIGTSIFTTRHQKLVSTKSC